MSNYSESIFIVSFAVNLTFFIWVLYSCSLQTVSSYVSTVVSVKLINKLHVCQQQQCWVVYQGFFSHFS